MITFERIKKANESTESVRLVTSSEGIPFLRIGSRDQFDQLSKLNSAKVCPENPYLCFPTKFKGSTMYLVRDDDKNKDPGISRDGTYVFGITDELDYLPAEGLMDFLSEIKLPAKSAIEVAISESMIHDWSTMSIEDRKDALVKLNMGSKIKITWDDDRSLIGEVETIDKFGITGRSDNRVFTVNPLQRDIKHIEVLSEDSDPTKVNEDEVKRWINSELDKLGIKSKVVSIDINSIDGDEVKATIKLSTDSSSDESTSVELEDEIKKLKECSEVDKVKQRKDDPSMIECNFSGKIKKTSMNESRDLGRVIIKV